MSGTSNPTRQFRSLGLRGIIHDPSPYDLPPEAWSGGNNVVFIDARAERAPVFRGIVDPLAHQPIFVVGLPASTGYDQIVWVSSDGHIYNWFSGTTTDVTPTSYPTVHSGYDGGSVADPTVTDTPGTAATFTPTAIAGQVTSGFLGDILYINNPTSGLFYESSSGGPFAGDPQWDPANRAAVFRVYNDYPVALNITKGVTTHPTMVKWGEVTPAGQTTPSWDAADPTKSAGENVLAWFKSPLRDGCILRDRMVLYGDEQTAMMTAQNNADVFSFAPLFSEGGIIGTNCVVEAGDKHYVFGPYDIWVHDGVEKQSLVDKRNRRFVFRNIVRSAANRCFVRHFPDLHLIQFAYVSSDPDCAFPSPSVGCNKAMLHNYFDDTQSFIDLPNVTMMDNANANTVLTWANAGTQTWENTGGTWASQEDGFGRVPVAVSASYGTLVTAHRLLAYDYLNKGLITAPYVSELNPPAYLERLGLDMSDEGAPLSSYKLSNTVYPQVVIYAGVPVTIQVGAALTPSGPITWAAPATFDPTTDYKVDGQFGGRYLAYRFSVAQPSDFEVSGFDAEILNNGLR